MPVEPLLGEIVMFAGNFPPRGWAYCNGALLQISSNTALFSILGTTYGGDGRQTFGLPDLRGRVPMAPGSGPGLTPRNLGQKGGAESVTVLVNSTISTEEQPHAHEMPGDSDGVEAQSTSVATVDTPTSGRATPTHTIVQPFQCVNYIIALQGVFPSRS